MRNSVTATAIEREEESNSERKIGKKSKSFITQKVGKSQEKGEKEERKKREGEKKKERRKKEG